ncbi:hypothetical protein ANCCAN_11326 [Ancylostoma caninum]|uniref:Uncharacterized protein n=1 Tax=Ancylostoma caninum TaxID=29170 RepID=A0A368GE70_ANCCA|nr:hypothetical protein ANCCAN_11326 [Ancylostoma caninum]
MKHNSSLISREPIFFQTLPTFFEENKKCLETRTDGLIAEQLWLSFHTIVNECSSKNYLVYRRHPNDELDVDHVVANAENWDCTIASYGLSQSSSVEVELAEEAPYCQIYGIGSDKRNEDKFTKIGEYFEAKDLLKEHDGVVEGDRERSERRKRETNYSDSDHAEVKKKEKSVEKVEKVKERRTEKGMYVLENPFEKDKISMREGKKKKKQNKTNSKLPTTKKEISKLDNNDKKDNGEKREREVNKLQKNEGGRQTQAHPPKRNLLLPQASENDENLGKDDKEGSHVNNATMNWHAELKEEPVGKHRRYTIYNMYAWKQRFS